MAKEVVEAVLLDPQDGAGVAPADLSPVDQRLVDEAVAWLNGEVNRSGLELAVTVRAYVLERFFGGSYEAFADPSRTKPASFTVLCKRDDLNLSHGSLYAMVRVGEQVQALPAELAHGLSVRHHRALLSLPDLTMKVELAERAVASGWTSDELEEAVRAARPPQVLRGRAPLPPVVKEFRALRRALGPDLTPDAVATLTPAQRQELDQAVADLESRLEAVRALLVAADLD